MDGKRNEQCAIAQSYSLDRPLELCYLWDYEYKNPVREKRHQKTPNHSGRIMHA
jgi:hypothetical protein